MINCWSVNGAAPANINLVYKEGWQSGRMRIFRKDVSVQADRGFESHPFRQ